jgi:hypothetical protein
MKNLLCLRAEKLEELPGREIRKHVPRHRHWHSKSNRWGTKYPTNKVQRFLRSNLGQRWNDVFSKYCHLDWIPADMRNLEHIKWDVVIDTFLKNGKVVYIPSYRSAEEPVDQVIIGGETERFYVDPQSKKLCVVNLGEKKAKDDKARKVSNVKTMRILGDYHQLLKLEGLWYEVKAEPIKPGNDLVVINGLYYKEADVKPVERVVNGVTLKDIAPADGVRYKIHNGKLYLPAKAPLTHYGWRHPLGPRDRIIEEPNGKPRWMRYNDVDPYSFKVTLRRQLNSKDLKRYGLKNELIIFNKRCNKCGGIVGKDCLYHFCAVCEKPKDECKCNRW